MSFSSEESARDRRQPVAIIGAGAVGCAIGHRLQKSGFPIAAIYSRTLRSSRAAADFIGGGDCVADLMATARAGRIIFITTPDDVIAELVEAIAAEEAFEPGSVLIHCSGALPSLVMKAAHACGAFVGSIHPLQSFASAAEGAEGLSGVACAYEGDPECLPILRDVIDALGARGFPIEPADKPLYHAAAVMASNAVVTVIAAAVTNLELLGLERRDALQAVLPLVRGTLNNLTKLGLPDALTGPVERGDVEVVRGHVKALRERSARFLPLYRELTREMITLAEEKGSLDGQAAARLRDLIRGTTTP